MNDFKEFTGKDVDEAIERACQFFEAKRDKLELEIVSGGSTGIFGLVGKKKAVVKARLRGRAAMEAGLDEVRGKAVAEPKPKPEPQPETRPAAKAETRPAPRREEPSLPVPAAPAAPPAPPASAGGDEDFDDEIAPPGNRIEQPRAREGNRIQKPKVREGNRIQEPVVREGNRIEQPRVREGNRIEGEAPADRQGNRGEGEAPADRPDSRRRTHRGGRGRRGGGAREGRPDQSERQSPPERQPQPGRQRRPEPARPAPAEPAKPLTADYDVEATVELAKGVVAKLVAPLCPEAPLTVEHEPGRIKVFIDAGADAELVIGSDGATIAALQYLANRMVARLSNAAVRVHLDAGEFREQQDEQLRQMALDLAAKAKEQGRTQSTRPLSSYHRRIIHLALQEDQTISTRSKGEGPLKRVLISPKKDQ